MEVFEHRGKEIHFYIDRFHRNMKGKNKALILFLYPHLSNANSLRIPFNGFDKDFKTDEAKLKLLFENIGKIEQWMTAPKLPEKTVTLDLNSETLFEDYCEMLAK